MAVDVNKYFRGLRSYLNTNTYEVTNRDNGRIVLGELENECPVLVG